jgi:2-ketocyclohexanecarboxyl-CoA hydrolase
MTTECRFSDIIYQKAEGVARITINRPETYNAFTDVTLREMHQALEEASLDHTVGVVVITGSGRNAFCSGGDVFWEAQGGLERIPFNINDRIGQCPKPVIARVNGYAIGAGNHMAYHCDFTIAAEHAIFGQNGPRVGSPANGETVSFLSHVVGHKRAREMWYLCRRYTARQAYEWGLANAVVPYADLDAEVARWCQELLALSPTCLRVLKASFEAEFDYLRGTGERLRRLVAADYFRTGEQQEGAAAFLERRRPDFSRWR